MELTLPNDLTVKAQAHLETEHDLEKEMKEAKNKNSSHKLKKTFSSSDCKEVKIES